jgi:hypothetical protein
MPGETNFDLDNRDRYWFRRRERAVAELAERQDGVVDRVQLRDLGFSAPSIGRRVDSGRLHVLHHGVYAVGRKAVTWRGRCRAALLAGGPGAVLSHLSAAILWGMLRGTGGPIHVTVPAWRPSHAGLAFHSAALPDDEVTTLDGLRVTTVFRTQLDLAATAPRQRLEKAVNEAQVLRLGDAIPLSAFLDRHRGHRGVGRLREALAADDLGAATRLELEERFRSFVKASSLPSPEYNAWLEVKDRWFEIDALWRDQGLAVELDSYRFHATKHAFARDRTKDRALRAAGLEVIRVTWWDLHPNATELEADLTALLATSGATRPGRRSSPG